MLRSEAWVWLARGAGATIGVLIIGSIAALVLGSSNVLVQVAIAILLAAGLEPVVGWLRGKTCLSRGVTILLVYLGFMVLVGLLLFLIVPAAISQLTEFSNRLPVLLADLRAFAVDIRPAVVSDGLVNAIDALASTLRDPGGRGGSRGPGGRRPGGRGRAHRGDHRAHAGLLLAHRPPAHPALLAGAPPGRAPLAGCARAGTRWRSGSACGCAARSSSWHRSSP